MTLTAEGRLNGKVALITGAARGIGRAQALRFAQEDADIVALDVCGPRGMAVDLDESAWRTMLDVNLTGVWHTCRAAAPHLIARGVGSMVLTSSIAGLRGLLGVPHYTAAKHGVVGLMRSLANELAPHNIRVNCINPTNVDTPMIQNDAVGSAFRPDLARPPSRSEFAEAAAAAMNMLSVPWIDPVDVANAALFLASDEARYITAIVLPVDAGATQR
ncbi:SDR family oxidoreductase [Mycobacterium sp. pR1184]|uniref:SDR family oxidoreductase n=1 Tax=Mycobacterium sp. pR1184 TaxID=3238981 RepID=UPI00351B5872